MRPHPPFRHSSLARDVLRESVHKRRTLAIGFIAAVSAIVVIMEGAQMSGLTASLHPAGPATIAASGALKNPPFRRFRVRPPGSPPVLTAPPVRVDNRVGVYVSATSAGNAESFDAILDRIIAAGGNAVVFDVKGSFVYFRTDAALPNELGLVRPVMDIENVVAAAKAKGIYTIARFISLKDSVFFAKAPEARIRHPKTGREVGNAWVDGSAPMTLEYNRQVLRALLKSGIDEVNLDYIRYPTEYGNAAIGLTGQEKADRVLAFIQMARETIDAERPETKLGISTYAILGWNFPVNVEALGQDFVRFAPYVHVISPMAYPSSFAAGYYYTPGKHPRSRMYYLVYQTLAGYRDLLPEDQRGKIRPWIQGYHVGPSDVKEQIDAVYAAGFCGYQIWNAQNNYQASYPAMKSRSERPERCRE